MQLAELLNEMILRYRDKAADAVLAHAGNIWVFQQDAEPDEPHEAMLADIAARTGLTVSDVGDIRSAAQDTRPDLLFGEIRGRTLVLDGVVGMTHYAETSPLVRKVMRQLGLTNVVMTRMTWDGDDREDRFPAKRVQGHLPEIVYHGTDTRHLRKILLFGLMPVKHGNWPDVGKFPDRIFLTANRDVAMFHANRLAVAHHTAPVVIATRIPDPAQLGLDFDVGQTFYGKGEDSDKHGYTRAMGRQDSFDVTRIKAIRQHSPKTDFGRATGVVAYYGRIRPSFFAEVFSTFKPDQPLGPGHMRRYKIGQGLFNALDRYEDRY